MHGYLKDAGADVGDKYVGKDYFPGVWDSEYIMSNQKEFTDMLSKYQHNGDFHGDPTATMEKIIANDGNEFGVDDNVHATSKPGLAASKLRTLDFISPEDRAKFSSKNLLGTLNSYVTQATKRAEWARRMGTDNAHLNAHFAEARSMGASEADIAKVNKYLDGVKGTLGSDISPTLRRVNSGMMVYQNISKLPLAIFSLAADPLQIMVRGGGLSDALSAYKRGVSEVKKSFTNVKDDEWTTIAKSIGVNDDPTLVHALGSSYSQGITGNLATKANNMFFKYNMMEQMVTSMRTSATQAAFGFLASHADGTKSVHSARWLDELGLKPGEVKVGKDGRPLYTTQDFLDAGHNPASAAAASLKIKGAINKWVDGAVLRPNAAHKPVWMNDPHYALFAHLKQFMYSFHETVLKRVGNELAHGNYSPALALMSYVPIMIAADAAKGALLTGGGVPSYEKDWGVGDYLEHGVERSSLYSIGQFGLDAYNNVKHGGTGVEALLGPTAEQGIDALRTLGGREEFSKFAMDSLPLSPIMKALSHSELTPDSMYAE